MKHFFLSLVLFGYLLAPTVSGEAVKGGELTISLNLIELLGMERGNTFKHIVPADKTLEWSAYIPQSYEPNVPLGLLVFINAGPSGRIPEEWKEIMDRRNLIWIGANNSGNNINTDLRVTYAVLAVVAIGKNNKIDPNRVYISGFSGGSRVASIVAIEYAGLFKGAIYNSGVNYWGKKRPPAYEDIKKNHYVFITGSKDFNLRNTRKVFKRYKRAGIPNIKLIYVPNMVHRNPDMGIYEEAVNYLDSRKQD